MTYYPRMKVWVRDNPLLKTRTRTTRIPKAKVQQTNTKFKKEKGNLKLLNKTRMRIKNRQAWALILNRKKTAKLPDQDRMKRKRIWSCLKWLRMSRDEYPDRLSKFRKQLPSPLKRDNKSHRTLKASILSFQIRTVRVWPTIQTEHNKTYKIREQILIKTRLGREIMSKVHINSREDSLYKFHNLSQRVKSRRGFRRRKEWDKALNRELVLDNHPLLLKTEERIRWAWCQPRMSSVLSLTMQTTLQR